MLAQSKEDLINSVAQKLLADMAKYSGDAR
jgi:hypothetical protein